jgi:CSLREA domain-containing protein
MHRIPLRHRHTYGPKTRKAGSAFIRFVSLYALLPLALLCAAREFAPAEYFAVRTTAQTANVFTVNTTADTNDGSCDPLGTGSGNKDCSLRDALHFANTIAGTDTVNFDLGLGAHTITLTVGELNVNQSVSISGPGSDLLTVSRSSAVNTPRFGVLNITAGTVSISGLTISGGSPSSTEGGGIRNKGTLTLNDCLITGNSSGFGGNGIYNQGQLTVNDSRIVANTGSGFSGGGIYNERSATTTINRTTIANNSAQGGGGIYNLGNFNINESTISGNIDLGISGAGISNSGSLTLSNSAVTGNTTASGDGAGINSSSSSSSLVISNTTISGNSTNFGWGGGCFCRGSVSLVGVTISDNFADVGGGVFQSSGGLSIANTIVAGNRARTASRDTLGAYASKGYNLIGDGQSNTTGFGAPGDQLGTSSAPVNAKLGTLAANGGRTQTHELLSGSPAIDKGTCSRATPVDQRGVLRYDFLDIPNADGGCDIGAYELEGPLTASIGDATVTEGTGGLVSAVFQVTLSRPSQTPVTVNFASEDFTAIAGILGNPTADYEPCNGILQFPAGVTSQTIACSIGTDDRDEFDELFFVRLSNPTGGASLASSVGFGIILDDDATPQISINDVTLAEPSMGQANAIFNVRLSAPSNKVIIVNYATADGTASAGNDYVAKSGTLVFQPGDVAFSVPVAINADSAEEPDETFFLNLSVVMNADLADSQGTATIGKGVRSGDVIISELRLRGPLGAEDEFIELYNNTDHAITVAVTDNSDGWALVSSDGVVRFTVPTGTVLPPRSHYLAVNDTPATGYSLSAVATGDVSYRGDIDDYAGVALFSTANPSGFVTNNLLDAVGFSSQLPALFKEGNALMSTASANGEYSFVRKHNTGRPADTSDNSNDFVLVSTDGGLYGGTQSTLGATGPENLQSPVALNAADLTTGLVDPAVCPNCGVNRVRSLASDPMNNSTFGTLTIRRTFTNNTGRELTRLRFRIIDITTFPSPSPAFADVRVLTSSDSLVTVTGGTTVFVHGTVLEDTPPQSHGGGLNSSLAVPGIAAPLKGTDVEGPSDPAQRLKSGGAIKLAAPLAPGQSVSVQFLLGVQQTGVFRFYVNLEALP